MIQKLLYFYSKIGFIWIIGYFIWIIWIVIIGFIAKSIYLSIYLFIYLLIYLFIYLFICYHF